MKKIGFFLGVVFILIGAGFAYIQFKKSTVEKSVIDYLVTEENIPKTEIASSIPFIANLQGDKNWMVSIKLKDDDKTYYYYKHQGEIILESIVVNGREYSEKEYEELKE